jgi:hypothetical protein
MGSQRPGLYPFFYLIKSITSKFHNDSEFGQYMLRDFIFKTALTSKRMIKKDPDWSHPFQLIQMISRS